MAGEALSGIGQGLNQSMGNFLQLAKISREENKDQRALQSPENQLKQAVSKQALEEFQKDQTKIKREDLSKATPYSEHLIEAAKGAGLVVGDEQEFTRGQIKEAQKYFMSNPRVLSSVIQKSYEQNKSKDTEYSAAIAQKQKELSELTVNPGDSVLNAKKIEKVQGELAELQKQGKPFSDGRMRDSQLLDKTNMLVKEQEYQKLSAEDKLIADSIGKDWTPEQVLKKKQEMKGQGQTSHVSVPDKSSPTGYRYMLYDPATGDYTKKSQPAPAPSGSSGQPTSDEVKSLAVSMAEGKLAPNVITKRGKSQAAVYSAVKDIYPAFDFSKAQANYNYMTDKTNLKVIGQVKAVKPRIDTLEKKAAKLQNMTQVPLLDKPLNEIRDLVGSRPVNDYESLRNAIIQEVGVALTGSSVVTDSKINIEMANLKSAKTYGQLKDSIKNLRDALDARTDASLSVPFAWDEVKGIKPATQTEQGQKIGRFVVEAQ